MTALALLLVAVVLTGNASVVDGDTIDLHGQHVRLWGIDAPESRQTCGTWRCGQAAALALADHIGARTVTCEQRGTSWERIVATCSVGGSDIGAWLVRNGWAVDAPKYSRHRYAPEQAEARAARRGVWASSFEEPWVWRKQH